MPAPIIMRDMSGLQQGLSQGFSAFNQALGQGLQQRQQRQGLEAFGAGIRDSKGDPNAIASAYQQALAAGADPQQLGALGQAYQEAKKNNAFKTAFDEALEVGGIDTPEGQNAFAIAYGREGGDPFKAIQMFQKNKGAPSAFDKKMDEFKAQSVIDYIQGGADSAKTFDDNLNFLEQNVDSVGRQAAVTTGKYGLFGGGQYGLGQTAEFAEYERRGNLVLDGVIKVFNKAGVLPEKKLKWIRDTFAVSPYDTQEQIRGRIAALRSLSKDTSVFSQGMGALIDKYGENIPTGEFLKLQKGLSDSFNKFEKAVASPEAEQVFEKLPTKGMVKGATATDTDTGQKFIYNGSRWVKQK